MAPPQTSPYTHGAGNQAACTDSTQSFRSVPEPRGCAKLATEEIPYPASTAQGTPDCGITPAVTCSTFRQSRFLRITLNSSNAPRSTDKAVEFRLRGNKVRLGGAAEPGANTLSILDGKIPELLGRPVREILSDYIQKDFLAATRSKKPAIDSA